MIKILSIIFIATLLGTIAKADATDNLPIINPASKGYRIAPATRENRRIRNIRNQYTIQQIYDAFTDGGKVGLAFDITGVTVLLDGRTIDPSAIYGKAYVGPYPFETKEVNYTYKRYRKSSPIKNGKTTINLKYLMATSHNSEDWTDKGQAAVRVELMLEKPGKDIYLGTYDTITRFRLENGVFKKSPSIIEGPMVNRITSNSPDKMVISFKAGELVDASVMLREGDKEKITRFTRTPRSRWHEVFISGLKPATLYHYYIEFEGLRTRTYSFRTAPEPGDTPVVFAYSGDGRAGTGGRDANFMGMNYATMERNANMAYLKGAQFFVMGGDLMNGYTASADDFRTQLHAWKQSMAGFWHQRPVYACLGNHEAILNIYLKDNVRNKMERMLWFDRWPYETQSVEAVFARELVHPLNAPRQSDFRRPPYTETVYSFQYGPVKIIAFNNNYWISRSRHPRGLIPKLFGGCPEGYIMKDQMDWIEKEIAEGDKNPTVKYMILFAQEPVFPNGGHPQDCMFYRGDNNVRAYVKNPRTGKLEHEGPGILEVRNRLVRLVGNSKKVAAVLGCDEHSYHKTLIDNGVPVGVPKLDDKNNDGVICRAQDGCSALKDLKYPTWYMVSGGSGAPYYSEEKTPWNDYWKKNSSKYPVSKHTSTKGCYYYSSQENFMIFETGSSGISVTVYNPYGEIIDKITNLMSVKK